jgi:hypothetical protein
MGVCHKCESRSGDCHTRCKYYLAECEERNYDRRQRLIQGDTYAGNPRLQRNSLRQIQSDRSGGR